MTKNLLTTLFLLVATILIGIGCNEPDSTPEAVATMTAEPIEKATETAVPQPTSITEPTILVEPATALADEPVTIQVLGLEPEQTVTVRASLRDDNKVRWGSEATFVADSDGMVDLTTQVPISGTYSAVDPMGLFWSMVPQGLAGRSAIFGYWDS